MPLKSDKPARAAVPREVVRFAIVGVSNTGVSFVSYWLLLKIGVWYVAGIVLAYCAGLANGYTWNRIWTFQAGRFSVNSLVRYVIVQGAGLSLSIALAVVFVEQFDVDPLLAQVLTWPPVVALSFVATRYWAFGR